MSAEYIEVKAEKKGTVSLLTPTGDLDHYGTKRLESVIEENKSGFDKVVLFDMAAVSYISSNAIRVFFALWKEMVDKDGVVALAGLQDYCRTVLENTQLTEAFTIHDTVEVALNFYGVHDNGAW